MRRETQIVVWSIGTTDLPRLVRAHAKAMGLRKVKIESWHSEGPFTKPAVSTPYTVTVSHE